MSNTIKDLEVLEKYLSEEELKEVARSVAFDAFKNSIGSINSENRKSNYEWYLKQGALEAVREHISDFDANSLTKDLQKKTKELIQKLTVYQLPDTYQKIAKEYIENNKHIIEDKMQKIMQNFVNKEDYNTAYSTFQEFIGERFGDLLYSLLEKEFKKW